MAEKDARKKPKKSGKGQARLLSVLKAVCVICVLLILIVIGANRLGNITFSSVGDSLEALVSGAKRGDGYPYYFESTGVRNVISVGSDLFVIGDDTTFSLDATARRFGEQQHAFSSPVASSAGGRVLLLDVGENSYRVLSKTKILVEGQSEQKLLTGALGKDGTLAVAARGENSQSKLTVFDKRHKEIFVWNCASENIIATAVSADGKRAAVSVVGAKDGALYTKVHIFDFDYNEPIASFSYDSVVSGLAFLSGDSLLLTGKNVFTVIDGTTPILEEDLSLNTLSCVYTDDSGCTVVSLSKYGSSASKIIRLYDRKGALQFETEIDESVKGVSCDSVYVSVLTDNYLYSFNRKGEQVGRSPVDADGIRPFTDGKNTYVYAISGVKCCKTAETIETTETTSAQPD